MRCENEYKALISKINVQKSNYSVKEMFVSNEIENEIQITTEKIKIWTIRLVVASMVMLVLLGLIYDFLKIINQKWIMWIVLGTMAAIFFSLLGIETFYKIKLKKILKKKEEEDKEKDVIRRDIYSLNDKISSLVVAVIVLNEHFYELATIKDEQKRQKIWDKYTLEVIAAINNKNNYHATYTEYQDYYREYEYYKKEKESY